jgi:hypothetical protein
VARLSWSLAGFLVCCSCAQLARAQSASPTTEWQPRAPRLRVGPFTGVAVPFGKVTSHVELHDATPVAYLIGGDLAWGPLLPLDFGIMVATTLGLGEPNLCPQPSSSCSLAVSGQLALRARYYFRPEARWTPWLGLGAGLDVLKITGQSTMSSSGIILDRRVVTQRSSTYLGPLGLLQGGVDFRLRRLLSLGGLVAFSLCPYMTVKDSVNVDGEDVTSSSGSLDPSLHYWLYVAAHVTFDARL